MIDTRPAGSREMIAVHDMFRRTLTTFPEPVDNVASGAGEHAAVVTGHVAFAEGPDGCARHRDRLRGTA